MNFKDELDKILREDPERLLTVKPKASAAITADERLISSFNEINDFVTEKGFEPQLGENIKETILYQRLKGIRENPDKIEALKAYDQYKLLDVQVKKINSIDDVLGDDSGILDSDAENIFKIKFIPKEAIMPDYVAKRKPCKDFMKFESLFVQCQLDLKNGNRKLRKFSKEKQIEQGLFFVLRGILLYVEEVGKRGNVNGNVNARLRVIFENGTESDMLLRSLAAELYKDGRRVTTHDDELLEDFENVTTKDASTGFIYILRSLSDNQKIKEIPHLYKIGFSTVPVEERIKNASQEPTYLMAAVSVIAVYQCYNLNPQKLEQLLHTFFGSACLNIDVYDANGTRFTPASGLSHH